MIGTLLSLLLVVGLAVLFGWLAVRAIRARRLWVKIAGGLPAALLTLLMAAIAFFAARGVAATYFPAVPAAPDLKVAGTAEQVARGEYLVNLACIGCHSAVGADGRPTMAQPLSGGSNMSASEGFGFIGDMVAENLTPGGKLASYSDGEIFRALRQSVDRQGHNLGFMSFLTYRQLSDQDTEAIIAYLRSLPPATAPVPTGDRLNLIGAVMLGAGLFGPAPERGSGVITAAPEGATADYGKYVATYGDCRGCHGPNMTGAPASAVQPAIPNPRPLVGSLSEAQFVDMMRSGVRPGNRPFPETMPWQNAAHMSDTDLAALYTYLTAPVP